MACDAEQWQEVGGVAGVAARRSGDVVAAVETQATPFSQVTFDRRGQSYVLSSRPPPRRLAHQPCSPWWCGCPWSLGPSRGPSAGRQQPGSP